MKLRIGLLVVLASAVAGVGCDVGCASISIVKPANGTTVALPHDIDVTVNGQVSLGDVSLDNVNMSQINGSHFQWVPKSTIYYASPGPHTLFVSATNTKTHVNLSESSAFTVSSCPLCYSCPTGAVHPITGQCCDNGTCDSFAFANFGPAFYQQPPCYNATFPGSTKYYTEADCISSDIEQISGGTPGPPRMAAVRFSPSRTGTLTHIQAPLGWTSGVNGVQVWVTSDVADRPGAVLANISVNNLRQQPSPTMVVSPVHMFFPGGPSLTAGTTYWLVIGPAAPTTLVQWNKSMLPSDVSIPNTTTLLLNTTTTNVTGPWAMKSNLGEYRPAFEIDVR